MKNVISESKPPPLPSTRLESQYREIIPLDMHNEGRKLLADSRFWFCQIIFEKE
jgi:hypothetical protein